ncbi:glycoside hydrolase family 43 protein [Mangrovibacterium diazotrophicum]|uniref:Beta-xylosidase n=1 Tax=Mangrovibacterium diazotrophicum TaxID=1261403 RepID=A0A419W6K4_9BACT|nr:glycoside hydrolase 43 family protein [Mangrovibacterium diazotrophicum]RKD91094.1 beta-xylosidase [Mangrovibacterium diazotrophicum]
MKFKNLNLLFALFFVVATQLQAQPWNADLGNGKYKNPILFADYSDPDVCRVGDDYYMTASSFNCVPGLPVLHSKDMVNWELIGYALEQLPPVDHFNTPQHGNGVWAPSIRYHEGELYIYWGDPDFGIYMVKAKDPAGPWSEPVLVKEGKGLIDSCPIWTEDGKAYLSYAFAGSRAGVKTVILMTEMTPDGTKAIGNSVLIFDGHDGHTTCEGTKLYQHGDYYYIMFPAGGVKPGWQIATRSKNIWGPYEMKVVLHQGDTDVNGPHQGALVVQENGDSWFYHFQDRWAYGRVVHLQPVTWVDGWPIPGVDTNKDGIGEPVTEWTKPDVGKTYPATPLVTTDEFNGHEWGLQWQWHANPTVYFGYMSANLGYLRLNCIAQPEDYKSLWQLPNLFLQKFPAPDFTATTKLTFNNHEEDDRTGLLVMGEDYAYIGLHQVAGKLKLVQRSCKDARTGGLEKQHASIDAEHNEIYLRVTVKHVPNSPEHDATAQFSYSYDGKKFKDFGDEFKPRAGRWIGAKIGLFATSTSVTNDAGYADIDWFRVE